MDARSRPKVGAIEPADQGGIGWKLKQLSGASFGGQTRSVSGPEGIGLASRHQWSLPFRKRARPLSWPPDQSLVSRRRILAAFVSQTRSDSGQEGDEPAPRNQWSLAFQKTARPQSLGLEIELCGFRPPRQARASFIANFDLRLAPQQVNLRNRAQQRSSAELAENRC